MLCRNSSFQPVRASLHAPTQTLSKWDPLHDGALSGVISELLEEYRLYQHAAVANHPSELVRYEYVHVQSDASPVSLAPSSLNVDRMCETESTSASVNA